MGSPLRPGPLASQELEWDRRLLTTLGTANKRLYELRVQTAAAKREASEARACGPAGLWPPYPLTRFLSLPPPQPMIRTILESFQCKEIEA